MAVHLDTGLSTSKFSVKKVDAFHRWAAGRSFYMFASSAESRARRTDWEYTPTGWFWNRKFGMKFYSGIAAAEYRRRLEQEERDHASFENIQKAY
jgi:hypothetical protein